MCRQVVQKYKHIRKEETRKDKKGPLKSIVHRVVESWNHLCWQRPSGSTANHIKPLKPYKTQKSMLLQMKEERTV